MFNPPIEDDITYSKFKILSSMFSKKYKRPFVPIVFDSLKEKVYADLQLSAIIPSYISGYGIKFPKKEFSFKDQSFFNVEYKIMETLQKRHPKTTLFFTYYIKKN